MARTRWPKPFRDIRVPLYGGTVAVFKKWEHLAQAFEHIAPGHDAPIFGHQNGMAMALTNERNGTRLYIVGWFDGSIPTLSHEMNHIAFMVLDAVGIDPRNDVGEAFCYLQDSLLRACGVR